MSIERFQPGVPEGAPDRVTFRVEAIGSTDAIALAKSEARQSGYHVKTLGRVWVPTDPVDRRDERAGWLVELVVRPKA